MKCRLIRPTICAAVLTVLVSSCATDPDKDPVQLSLKDLDARVTRLEHIEANQVVLAQQIDDVQATLRELRGRIDQLEHNSDALGKQQRDLYGDLKKRLDVAAAGGAGIASAGDAAAATTNAAPSSVEQAVYTQAFDALKAGSLSVAITGFKDFLATYPGSSLAPNAQYWLGEAYYVNKEYDNAAGAFRTVLKKWPDSNKAPDALLKLGYTQYYQKQYPAARATLTEVTTKYPGTETAKLATGYLHKIPQ